MLHWIACIMRSEGLYIYRERETKNDTPKNNMNQGELVVLLMITINNIWKRKSRKISKSKSFIIVKVNNSFN